MTNQDINDKFQQIAKSHWREYETFSEHADRVHAAERECGSWFDAATKPQRAAYVEAISAWYGDWSPRANRIRDAARAAFYASTVEASELCLKTFAAVMVDGEVPESLMDEWDDLILKQILARAA
jgi:hypothetical protein